MSNNRFTFHDRLRTVALTAIAIFLGFLAFRPGQDIPRVHAQAPTSNFYIEPGTTIIRSPDNGVQIQGKVVVDLRNGDIWGFPTNTSAPYPVVITNGKPPVSEPVYLGRFDFSAMKK